MILLQIDPLTRPVAISEMLLLLAVAAFIGWLLARLIMNSRLSRLQETIVEKRNELADCKSKRTAAIATLKNKAIATPAFVADLPKAVIKKDNLKRIEGIGPKIEEILNEDGIQNFAQLAATNSEHISLLLNAAGTRFHMHNPETWPQQSALARDGKWDELKELQDRLDGGKE